MGCCDLHSTGPRRGVAWRGGAVEPDSLRAARDKFCSNLKGLPTHRAVETAGRGWARRRALQVKYEAPRATYPVHT